MQNTTKNNQDGESIYYIVLDAGGHRQLIVEDHSKENFSAWSAGVLHELKNKLTYTASVLTVEGEHRHQLVSITGGAATVGLYTWGDLDAIRRRAQLAQGGNIIQG